MTDQRCRCWCPENWRSFSMGAHAQRSRFPEGILDTEASSEVTIQRTLPEKCIIGRERAKEKRTAGAGYQSGDFCGFLGIPWDVPPVVQGCTNPATTCPCRDNAGPHPCWSHNGMQKCDTLFLLTGARDSYWAWHSDLEMLRDLHHAAKALHSRMHGNQRPWALPFS